MSEPGGPQVTCIMIFLDEERFLAEAIESVLAQTYRDFELLLVDDGSRDASPAIARRYEDLDPERVRCLNHPGGANRGMSASRNLGLAHARGRLIAFLDGDDAWLADKLAAQVDLFAAHPEAALVCGATEYWRSWAGGGAAADEIRHVGAPPDALIRPPEAMKLLYPLGRGASPSTSGFMVRRETAEAVGGFEDEFRDLYEDQAFKVKVFLSAPIYVSSRCFDRYRQHADSCVQVADAGGRRDAARGVFLRWLEAHLDRTGYADPELRRLLSRALLRYRYPRLRRAVRAVRGLGRRAPWPVAHAR